jgi:hypothetical protein
MNPIEFLVAWLNAPVAPIHVTRFVGATLTAMPEFVPKTPSIYSGLATLVTPGFSESPLEVTANLDGAAPNTATFTAQIQGVQARVRGAQPFVEFLAQPVFGGVNTPFFGQPQLLSPPTFMNPSARSIQLSFSIDFTTPLDPFPHVVDFTLLLQNRP